MIFDRDTVIDRIDGDTDLLDLSIAAYLESIPTRMAALDEAVQCADMEIIRLQAHTLKGASANLGALEMQAAAKELESALGSGDMILAGKIVAKIHCAFDELRAYLKNS